MPDMKQMAKNVQDVFSVGEFKIQHGVREPVTYQGKPHVVSLKMGTSDYPCERAFKEASLRGQKGRDILLSHVSIEALMKKRNSSEVMKPPAQIRGVPIFIAHDLKAKRVWLFPEPMADFELILK